MQIETDGPAANPDLVALLGSRICHDLTSPLGAIGNGVELLVLSGARQGPEMQLIAESVAAAQARIRVFRLAFGTAAKGQRIAGAEIAAILAAASGGGRLGYRWTGPDQVLRSDAKLAFLAALCAETALPRGGTIGLSCDTAGWAISGTGPVVRLEQGLADCLVRGADPGDVAAAQIQFALLPAEARRSGRRISGEITAAALTLRFA